MLSKFRRLPITKYHFHSPACILRSEELTSLHERKTRMNTPYIITRPASDEYPEWFAGEIELVQSDDLLATLGSSFTTTHTLLSSLDHETLRFRYQPEKWSIKEIWQHVIDCERILSYRALRYARGDSTVLAGFDENRYATASEADARDWEAILDEYAHVRTATLDLFRSFTPAMIGARGTAGRSNMTVRSVCCLILGHEIHHVATIEERYLRRKPDAPRII